MADRSFEIGFITGIAEFPCINSKVAKFGDEETGYSLNVVLDEEQLKVVQTICTNILTTAQENPDWVNFKGSKVPKKNWLPVDTLVNRFIKERDGKSYFVAKAPHMINGERVYIPLFNAFGPIPDGEAKNKNVKYGSKVSVEVVFYVYYSNSNIQGVKAKLKGVQILEEPADNRETTGGGFKFKTIDEEDVPI